MIEEERRRLRAVIELETAIDLLGKLADYYLSIKNTEYGSTLYSFKATLIGLVLELDS